MRAVSDLGKLNSAFQYRLLRLRRSYLSVPTRPREDQGAITSHAVIELDNLVLSTLREFTISSLRRARTSQGQRISTNRSFGPEEEIAAYMLSVVNPVGYSKKSNPTHVSRWDEPTIRDPRDTEKILLSCSATNIGSMQNALSLNTSLFRDLCTLRNFYAHRNSDTWRKVKVKAAAMGVLGVKHTDEIIQTTLLGKTISLFEEWLDEAEIFFDELTK